jgi:Na+-driven multidrug efflux pump
MIVMALASVITIFSGQNWSMKKEVRVKSAYKISTLFVMGWGVLNFIVCLLFSADLARVFNTDESVVKIASDFLVIVSFSYGFQGLIMVSGALLNGINKPIQAMIITLLRMLVVYVPLAWILSNYFGLTGIFWAAFLANIVSGIYAFISVRSKIAHKHAVSLKVAFSTLVNRKK